MAQTIMKGVVVHRHQSVMY